MQKVIFVCLGNICRSPMAEALFRDQIEKSGLKDNITVASAATSRWEIGNAPHEGTRAILDQMGVSYQGMQASQIQSADFLTYDFIIGMDATNVKDLKKIAPKGTEQKIHLFMDTVEDKKGLDVPDPYYTGDFKQTFNLINEGTVAWLLTIRKKQK